MIQTRKTGSTISCLWPALSDHARMPVMLPRKSDSDMRRDGSNAACEERQTPVDEPGRVHGVPDLDSFAQLRSPASNSLHFTAMEERWRWRLLHDPGAQIRGQDKSREVRGGRSGVGARQNNGLPRCAPGARNVRNCANARKSSLFRTSRRIAT